MTTYATLAELADKVSECMALGTKPLSPERIARFSARVMAIDEIKDMAGWFDGI